MLFAIPLCGGYNMGYYEKIIAREFNRTKERTSRYSSVQEIVNRPFQGLSTQQKNNLLTDLEILKNSIAVALHQAEEDGARVWYYLYIWKDNEIVMSILNQYYSDVDKKIAECQWLSHPDFVRGAWSASKYTATVVVTIIALWASQNYLSKEYHLKNGSHGLFEMLKAPFAATQDAAIIAIQKLSRGRQ